MKPIDWILLGLVGLPASAVLWAVAIAAVKVALYG